MNRTILLSYIRMYHGLKAQGISREGFPYRAPLQPYLSYFGVSLFSSIHTWQSRVLIIQLFWFTIITLLNGFPVFLQGNWDTSKFIAAYISKFDQF